MKGKETLEALMNGKYIVTKYNPNDRRGVWKMEDDGLYLYSSKYNTWILGVKAKVWELMRIEFEEYEGEPIPINAPVIRYREDFVKFMASKKVKG